MFYYIYITCARTTKISLNTRSICGGTRLDELLTFDVGSIHLSFRMYTIYVHPIHVKAFSIQHFSQIVPRVCTLVLFIIFIIIAAMGM